ncbi:hypothetical protein E2C01_084788 [Portunus trituberculatus]|uniref:Uncharacterized protein n=1 Tax=Portunus trituberculatus TaxID=210409 RepID=A0A5B7JA76_PORTR|nr:hypothetical protein [Portunus trituberculatus]
MCPNTEGVRALKSRIRKRGPALPSSEGPCLGRASVNTGAVIPVWVRGEARRGEGKNGSC